MQDESSMLVGAVSGIKPGQEVLDVCAAPGGKSLHAADLLAGTGVIFSCDLSETKVHLIQENMERAGVDHCELYRQNARILRKDWIDSVDVLIADLPCSANVILNITRIGKILMSWHRCSERSCGLSANMYGRVVYCYIVRVPLQEKKIMITFRGSKRHFRLCRFR